MSNWLKNQNCKISLLSDAKMTAPNHFSWSSNGELLCLIRDKKIVYIQTTVPEEC